jgi:hypothetical protein
MFALDSNYVNQATALTDQTRNDKVCRNGEMSRKLLKLRNPYQHKKSNLANNQINDSIFNNNVNNNYGYINDSIDNRESTELSAYHVSAIQLVDMTAEINDFNHSRQEDSVININMNTTEEEHSDAGMHSILDPFTSSLSENNSSSNALQSQQEESTTDFAFYGAEDTNPTFLQSLQTASEEINASIASPLELVVKEEYNRVHRSDEQSISSISVDHSTDHSDTNDNTDLMHKLPTMQDEELITANSKKGNTSCPAPPKYSQWLE